MLTEVTHTERLAALRAELTRLGVDGFLIPRSDEYLGEYVPPSGERLAWLTGFTGSAGMAIVLRDRAAVFTDGRYTTQVAAQTDPALWERRHITEEPPQDWLAEAAAGLTIGFDPWLHAQAAIERLAASGVTLVPFGWTDPHPRALLPWRTPSNMPAWMQRRSAPSSRPPCAWRGRMPLCWPTLIPSLGC